MTEKFSSEAVARAALGPPARKAGAELLWHCSNHADEHPSLSVNPAKNAWLCGPCGSSGNAWQLAAFLAKVSADDKPAVTAWLREHGLLNGTRAARRGPKGRPVATYDYTDESGKAVFQVVRFPPKNFRQRRPDGNGGWIWNMEGVQTILYNLPEVLKAKSVVILEGEKDCETAKGWHLAATTNPMGAGKWRPEYAEALRGKRIAIIADADERGRPHAREVARSLSGMVETVKLLELPGAKDLTEWVERGGTRGQLLDIIKAAPEWKPYALEIGALLDKIVALIRRYVVMTAAQVRVVALWVIHTHCLQAADATPYLSITSPEKESGKTLLLEVLEMLVFEPWLTGRTTAAVLPRRIEARQPALLLDESDAAFASDKEYAETLRGVLNSGYRRSGIYSCCVGQGTNISYKDFPTFCPKAIAGIGRLPDTVADRSIPIRLKRAMKGERGERFRKRNVRLLAEPLRQELEQWAAANTARLLEANPTLPEELSDRQQDVSEPLLAIADAAGGEWPERARRALVELCGEARAADDSVGVRLLADIRQIFSERKVDRLPSAELAKALAEIETSPWGEWSHGKPITLAKLARILRPFGIFPRVMRDAASVFKGYSSDEFLDAFGRYLPPDIPPFPPSPGSQTVTPLQASIDAGPGHFSDRYTVTAQKCEIANKDAGCNDVTVSSGGEGPQGDGSGGKPEMVEYEV